MKKILAVDDQPQIVRLIQVNLQKAGYQVVTAFDGEEGLQKVLDERPDLVILDVIMPKRDGFDVLRTIKTNPDTRHMPVIMLTVKAQDADIFEGLKEGAELYLPKPFHPTELVSLVQRVLDANDAPPPAVSSPG
jgi:two-component system alkaline phosphatase synthesis response regulator PhoP/two-component system response regulator VicR